MTSLCPHCKSETACLEYTRIEKWTVVRSPDSMSRDGFEEEGAFKRVVRQSKTGKCDSCGKRVKL